MYSKKFRSTWGRGIKKTNNKKKDKPKKKRVEELSVKGINA